MHTPRPIPAVVVWLPVIDAKLARGGRVIGRDVCANFGFGASSLADIEQYGENWCLVVKILVRQNPTLAARETHAKSFLRVTKKYSVFFCFRTLVPEASKMVFGGKTGENGCKKAQKTMILRYETGRASTFPHLSLKHAAT